MKPSSLVNPLNYYIFFRRRSLLRRFRSVGRNFLFDPLSTFVTPHDITIGNDVFIGERAHISGDVTIGNNVMFGPRPMLIAGDHLFGVRTKSVRFLHPIGRENSQPISIEDESWFGAGVIILGGVAAGVGCIVGAGSVVSKSIPPFTVAVGNPCRPIKRIFSDDHLFEHIIGLGSSRDRAQDLITRRKLELGNLNRNDLPIIDNTDTYWQHRTP